MSWYIQIWDKTQTNLIFAAKCGDRREAVSLATEARSHSLSYVILLRDSFDNVSSWD